MSDVLSQQQIIGRLRAIRQAKRWTVQQVADTTGIDRATLAKLEKGHRGMFNVDEAVAICEALGVDLRVVMTDAPMPIATEIYVV